MRIGLLKNFLHCFTLKQGTVLIAIVQLFASGIVITFCLLALAHAMDIQEMVARDSEDALEREAFEDGNSMHLNTRKMEIAHQNATEKVYIIYSGLVLVVIHLVSIILLLYGVLINNRNWMAPWMIVNLIEFGALISVFLVHEKFKSGLIEKIIVVFAAHINLYCCFVVYSTYKGLDANKGLTHEIHGAAKKKYTHPPAAAAAAAECSKSRSRAVNQPYDV